MILARAQIAEMVSGAKMVLTLELLQEAARMLRVPCVPAASHLLG